MNVIAEKFKVDIIDAWNMTITPVKQIIEVEKLNNYNFINKNKTKIKLPGKPYIALRVQKIGDEKVDGKKAKRNELTDEEQ